MRPSADHGEHSYRGSGKLTGKAAVITGGDSDTARWVEDADRTAVRIPGDLSDPAHCREVVARAVGTWGRSALDDGQWHADIERLLEQLRTEDPQQRGRSGDRRTSGWSGPLGRARSLLLPAALGRVRIHGPVDVLFGYLPDLEPDIWK